MLTYHFLQCYSWIVDSFVAATYGLLMFVYGAGSMIFVVGRNERQRNVIFSVIDTKWRFTLASLLLFFAYAFIAFPGFQSDDSGAGVSYWIPYMLLIILHAISCELLRRHSSIGWLKSACRWIIVIAGWTIPGILGFLGARFFVGNDVYNELNVALGIMYMTGSQTIGLLYIYCVIYDTEIKDQIIRVLKIISTVYIVSMLALTYFIFTHDSVGYDEDGNFFIVSLGYFSNLVEMPHALALVIAGISLSVIGVVIAVVNSVRRSFWFSALGFLIYITSFFSVAGLNDTAVFPNFNEPQLSLTIANSSASQSTLTILAFVSLLLPVAAWYLDKIWSRQIHKEKEKR